MKAKHFWNSLLSSSLYYLDTYLQVIKTVINKLCQVLLAKKQNLFLKSW